MARLEVAGPVEAAATRLPQLVTKSNLGAAMARATLIVNQREWVSRRVETFQFTDVDIVRRQMSVDFRLPRAADEAGEMETKWLGPLSSPEVVMVPIVRLAKEKLSNFDLRDDTGATLPTPNSSENAHLSATALVAAAGLAASEYGFIVRRDLSLALGAVVRLPSPYASIVLKAVRHDAGQAREEMHRALAKSGEARGADQHRSLFEAAIAAACRLEDEGENHITHTVLSSGPVAYMAGLLVNGFMLYAPVADDRHRRRVYKISYETQLSAPRDRGHRPLRRQGRRLAERCAWAAKQYSLDSIGIGTSGSHHLEMYAPDGTVVYEATFTAAEPAAREALFPDAEPGKEKSAVIDEVKHGNDQRAHVFLSNIPPGWHAAAAFTVRVTPEGSVNVGFWVAALISTLFFVGSGAAEQIQGESAAAVLLVAPSLLAVFVGRFGEHPLLAHSLTGVRAFVYLAGLLSFSAAAFIAFGYEHERLERVWEWLRWFTLVPLAGLTVSQIVLRWRRMAGWVKNLLGTSQ